MLAVVIGSAAALVQTLGLIRWPYAVPELARRYVSADGPEAAETRRTIEVVFATLHRLLGVGIGEHLGYLLTGLWTLLVAALDPVDVGRPVVARPDRRCRSAIALLIGTLEFVGPNERDGWHLAGIIVPIAYIAWSIWLIVAGDHAHRLTGHGERSRVPSQAP